MTEYHYAGDVFLQPNIEAARSIILTPEAGLSTDERWQRETAWLMERLVFPQGLLVDFGCGIGRLSKQLIARGNSVIGVDRSFSMRAMAEFEVAASDTFTAASPEMLCAMQQSGLRARGALAVWTLQHIPLDDLLHHVELLYRALEIGAPFWTMERPERYVPVRKGDEFHWLNDGVWVPKLLVEAGFILETETTVPDELCAPGARLRHWVRGR